MLQFQRIQNWRAFSVSIQDISNAETWTCVNWSYLEPNVAAVNVVCKSDFKTPTSSTMAFSHIFPSWRATSNDIKSAFIFFRMILLFCLDCNGTAFCLRDILHSTRQIILLTFELNDSNEVMAYHRFILKIQQKNINGRFSKKINK